MLLQHVPLHVHRQPQDVYATSPVLLGAERGTQHGWIHKFLSQREVPLLVEVLGVDASVDEVFVELRLLWVEDILGELVNGTC